MLQLQVQSTLFIYFLSVDFISTFFRTGFLTDVDGEWVGGGGRGWGEGEGGGGGSKGSLPCPHLLINIDFLFNKFSLLR